MLIPPNITVRSLTIVTVLTAVAVVQTVAPAAVPAPAQVVAVDIAFSHYPSDSLLKFHLPFFVFCNILYTDFRKEIVFHVYFISRRIISYHYRRCYRSYFFRSFCCCCRPGYCKLITEFITYKRTTGTS